ncbi:MAG: MFS transporter [Alphaproteobacteria bacterium]
MPILLLIVCINFVGVGALIPILPYTILETMGQPASVMTLLLASFALAMFVANPILGRLSDYFGRRLVLFLSLGVAALAHLWFALSDDITHLFMARIVAGLGSGNTGVIQAMITDRTTPEKRAQYMGLLGAAIGVGFIAGPALGGLLSDIGDGPLYRTPFLLAAGFAGLALVMTFWLKGVGRDRPDPGAVFMQDTMIGRMRGLFASPLALYAIASLMLNLSFAQVEASFVLVLRDYLGFGAVKTGWLFTYIGMCIIIVQAVLIKSIVARLGEVGTTFLGTSLLALGQVITILVVMGLFIGDDYPLVQTMLATTAICFGFALSTPAITAAVSKIAGASSRGGSLGTIQGFGSLGQVVGLVVAGPLYDLGGSQYPFGFGAVVTICLVAIVTRLARPPQN